MRRIVWLASYPKSGNTWFRTFLVNLIGDRDEPASINELRTGSIASARPPFDDHTGLEASDLTEDEIDLLRPKVYQRMSDLSVGTARHKVHDAYVHNRDGDPLFPTAATLGAVYLVRNPLDVAPSYAHHSASDIDWAVRAMCDPEHAMSNSPRNLQSQFRQIMGTWSDHVTSWIDDAPFPVEVVRYEDMHLDAQSAFTRGAQAADVEADAERIRRAIEFSAFDEVKRQEETQGFNEKNPRAASFFRAGKIGSWRDALTDDQAAQLVDVHGEVMERLGYLKNGEPTF